MRRILMWLQAKFIKQITFTGDFADILMARRKWRDEYLINHGVNIILLSVDYKQSPDKNGKLKCNKLTIYFVEENAISSMLGFKKNFVHYALMKR